MGKAASVPFLRFTWNIAAGSGTEGLPAPRVLQRGVGAGAGDFPAVEAEVQDVERIADQDLEALVLQRLVVRRCHEVVPVDRAGLQLLTAGVAVRDGAEDQLVEQRRLAPVVLVADEGDL